MEEKQSGEHLKLRSLHIYLLKLVERRLWLQVLVAIALGVGVGMLMSEEAALVEPKNAETIGNWLALPGKIFMKLVQMIMIPLIFSSIIGGISSNSNSELKKMGLLVFVYFLISTVVSIIVGIILALLMQPGSMMSSTDFMSSSTVAGESFSGKLPSLGEIPTTISELLPANPLEAMVSGEMLSIVIFTIIIGVAITKLTSKTLKPIMMVIGAIQEICMTIVKWAMKIVPYAVFGLMAQLTASIGFASITSVAYYFLVVIIGLLILLIIYMIVVGTLGRTNPFQFLKKIGHVQLLAFSTTSSAAVMPLSLKTAEDKLNVSPGVSNFIIPIGATVNMDGTAIFQCITTLFIAQAYGMEMSMVSIVLVMLTVVGASIGTPGIPGGGVIILASVLQSAGIPSDGIMLVIGVDRILGMFRTAINVTGDLTAAVVFDRWIKRSVPK